MTKAKATIFKPVKALCRAVRMTNSPPMTTQNTRFVGLSTNAVADKPKESASLPKSILRLYDVFPAIGAAALWKGQ